MPDIRHPETVKAIARELIANGHNQEQALLTVGYGKCTARNGKGAQICADKRVKDALREEEARLVKRSDYTIDNCDADYERVLDLSIELKQPSAAVSAITGRARLRGWDKDHQVTEQPATVLTPEELEAAQEAARGVIKLKVG